MRRLLLIIPLMIWALAYSSNAIAQDHGEQEDDVEIIRALMERVATLMEAGDLDPISEIYAPGKGVHIIEGAGVNHGWEDYLDHHLKPELASFKNFKYSMSAIEPQVRGDMAYSPYRYELSADAESGHLEVEGRGTMIFERMDGKWRIVHRHTSGRRKQP